MRVQLRLDAYPYQENGYVQGKVVYISDIAIDSGFICLVELDKGLITNQKRGIRYKNGLTAKGLVITKEMRLLERLFYAISNISSLH